MENGKIVLMNQDEEGKRFSRTAKSGIVAKATERTREAPFAQHRALPDYQTVSNAPSSSGKFKKGSFDDPNKIG